MKIKLVLLLTGVTLLAGCATVQNYSMAVSSWRGVNVRNLESVWGYPHRIQRLQGGHRLYVYRSVDRGRYPTVVNPGYTSVKTEGDKTYVTTVPSSVSGGGTYDYRCTTWFEVNRANIIVNTSFRGNNCEGTSGFVTEYGYNIQPQPY